MVGVSEAPRSGLIAILRGITPDEVVAVGSALVEAGFHAIEVPLNSPDPYRSIELLATNFGRVCPVGAGTVLHPEEVERARSAGAEIIVSPDTHPEVIAATRALGMRSYPGVATATEAFGAIRAGARSLKLFPSTALGISGMRALSAVLPVGVELIPVGGVDESNLAEWRAAGAGGAGIGTSVYRPGDSAGEVRVKARRLSDIWASTL
ncbi:2-dehydro-3-deoxy-6-phosphogalactonate aldolase [Nocardia jinanensis]|uniref:2-dehydro-3-deoxy-6-phosphogalactonate aldolase n=1 Tax=Nocardia jinanensis TaxID=382504 RepID=A0A917RZX5_9NOCA|nr:2-dehydro-3-deoxy-6-phosphogalactonate aldolase [Nocardia jinanensis]GGL45637.1 2-dehydro-3-deoxy-6-phosphogalactonate aldolase [Nocardia jinanensis]